VQQAKCQGGSWNLIAVHADFVCWIKGNPALIGQVAE
jgi:hypothetical protein